MKLQRTQAVDNVIRCLPGDICKNDITSGPHRGPRQHRETANRGVI